MENARILITEDDEFTRELLAAHFEKEGVQVLQAATAEDMHKTLAKHPVDLVLLDINLPDEDGFALTRQLRARSDIPIVILSVRGDGADRVTGLELGADDYVSKAWSPRELFARVSAVLRRTRGADAGRGGEAAAGRALTFAGFRLDPEGHTLRDPEGEVVPLTTGEFNILSALARAKGRTLTREHLLDALSHGPDAPFDRTVDVLISRLRKKLGDTAAKPRLIRTVPGVGYQLVDPQ